MIQQKALNIIHRTFVTALQQLNVPPMQIAFAPEPMGQRFPTKDNAMEVASDVASGKAIVHINEDWANTCLQTYPFDLHFLAAHEARHIYQDYQISLLQQQQPTSEEPALIQSWIDNKGNYHRNTGPDSFEAYICQPIEVDANAYANLYVMLHRIGQPRMSAESDALETQRLKEIANQFGFTISE